ncbi:hypothetical protein, partial [Biformimicrobium ophioploci]|uniref:hypothetical protein n=1 Tax=Biformimicrobium ophioploci TaxID=3036711 RepID=UPI002555AAD0
ARWPQPWDVHSTHPFRFRKAFLKLCFPENFWKNKRLKPLLKPEKATGFFRGPNPPERRLERGAHYTAKPPSGKLFFRFDFAKTSAKSTTWKSLPSHPAVTVGAHTTALTQLCKHFLEVSFEATKLRLPTPDSLPAGGQKPIDSGAFLAARP